MDESLKTARFIHATVFGISLAVLAFALWPDDAGRYERAIDDLEALQAVPLEQFQVAINSTIAAKATDVGNAIARSFATQPDSQHCYNTTAVPPDFPDELPISPEALDPLTNPFSVGPQTGPPQPSIPARPRPVGPRLPRPAYMDPRDDVGNHPFGPPRTRVYTKVLPHESWTFRPADFVVSSWASPPTEVSRRLDYLKRRHELSVATYEPDAVERALAEMIADVRCAYGFGGTEARVVIEMEQPSFRRDIRTLELVVKARDGGGVKPSGDSWLRRRDIKARVVTEDDGFVSWLRSTSEHAKTDFPDLGDVLEEVGHLDIGPALAHLSGRKRDSENSLSVAGVTVPSQVASLVAPVAMLFGLLYLHAHVAHVRTLVGHSGPDGARAFPWIATMPGRHAAALTYVSTSLLSLAALAALVTRTNQRTWPVVLLAIAVIVAVVAVSACIAALRRQVLPQSTSDILPPVAEDR